jgi:hypothetical protein
MRHFLILLMSMLVGLLALIGACSNVSETGRHVFFAISVACLLCAAYSFIQIIREQP